MFSVIFEEHKKQGYSNEIAVAIVWTLFIEQYISDAAADASRCDALLSCFISIIIVDACRPAFRYIWRVGTNKMFASRIICSSWNILRHSWVTRWQHDLSNGHDKKFAERRFHSWKLSGLNSLVDARRAQMIQRIRLSAIAPSHASWAS